MPQGIRSAMPPLQARRPLRPEATPILAALEDAVGFSSRVRSDSPSGSAGRGAGTDRPDIDAEGAERASQFWGSAGCWSRYSRRDTMRTYQRYAFAHDSPWRDPAGAGRRMVRLRRFRLDILLRRNLRRSRARDLLPACRDPATAGASLDGAPAGGGAVGARLPDPRSRSAVVP